MSVTKLSSILFILPLTTKIYVQCEASVSKSTIMTKLTVTPHKSSTTGHVPILRQAQNAQSAANRFTIPDPTAKFTGRTAPFRDTLPDQCDFIAKYCHKTYTTSAVCGRTLQYQYQSFKNYCMLDFVNCREGHEIWQILHMGKCHKYKEITDYLRFPYLIATAVKLTPSRKLLYQDFQHEKSRMSAEQMGNDQLRARDPNQHQDKYLLRNSGTSAATNTRARTTPPRFSLYEECEYLARPCLHSHKTGKICAKAQYTIYKTFRNYCMLDFVNCREGFEVWFPVYMGDCIELPKLEEYMLIFNICIRSENAMRPTQKWKYKPTDWNVTPPVQYWADVDPPSALDVARQGGKKLGGGKPKGYYMETLKSKRPGRTTMEYISAHEPCDYLVINCFRAFQTGKVCGRTTFYRTRTFKNFCMLDYANCVLRYELFQLLHMGECIGALYPAAGSISGPNMYESYPLREYYFKDPFIKPTV